MVRNERGLTLAELVVGMAVMALVMAAVFGLLSSSIGAQTYGMKQEASFTEARRAMATISDELRYATVTAPAAGATASQISYTTRSGENRTISLGAGADAGTVLIARTGGTERVGKGLIQTLTFARHTSEALVTIDVAAAIQTNVTSAFTLTSQIRYGRVNRY